MEDGDPIVPKLSCTPESSSSGNNQRGPPPLMNLPDPVIFLEELFMMGASSSDPKLNASIIAIATNKT